MVETVEGLNAPAVAVRHDDHCALLRTVQERPPGLGRWQAVLYKLSSMRAYERRSYESADYQGWRYCDKPVSAKRR